ncbi:AraC-like DNA-binding protein [Haloferula luteola]|uniref:AraC-like DNA-binding protein n=1 Tax=Haloferula luteola TaxID=595692 RepID=A0A840V5Q5_9BACT|nr:helix-turn-helix domain-containing protein [Haloferula luteola]MBB5353577.1 AraC-like DNA-binding protein [Haloferula luteola]
MIHQPSARLAQVDLMSHPAWPDYQSALEHLSRRPIATHEAAGLALENADGPPVVVRTSAGDRPVLWIATPQAPLDWRRNSLMQLVQAMIRWVNMGRGPWPKPTRVVWRLIQNHSDQSLDLGSIAKHLDMAPARLGEQFTLVTGLSFRRLLGEERCACAAKMLLEHPEQPIAEIAISCSGQSVSQFNRNFLSATGSTPRQFRRTGHT